MYNPDIDGKLKIETQPKINNTPTTNTNTNTTTNTTKPTITILNDFTEPVVDNRPQYLKDRDREEARASAEDDRKEAQKIIQGIQKKDDEDEFYKSPIEYEGSKLFGETIGKL